MVNYDVLCFSAQLFIFLWLIIILFSNPSPCRPNILSICCQLNFKLFASGSSVLSTPSNVSEILCICLLEEISLEPSDLLESGLATASGAQLSSWDLQGVHSCRPGIFFHHHLGILFASFMCWVFVSWIICLVLSYLIVTTPHPLPFFSSTVFRGSLRKDVWEVDICWLFMSENVFILSP